MQRVSRSTPFGSMIGLETVGGGQRFAGIRYATAGRFEPPVAVDDWPDGYDATAFGAACVQAPVVVPLVPGSALGADESEDCLHLNVWVPPGAGPFPVVVWIHGGSFLTGASSQSTYEATALAQRGVVVVSVNYRVGPFGFLDLHALDGAPSTWVANAGLHDIVAALRWVRRHIGAFSGDPASVTVLGESAGGGSILHLLDAPHRAELFDRAFVQSGSAGRTFTPEVAALIAGRFLAAAGADIETVATLAPEALVAAIGPTMGDPDVWGVAGMMPFHPVVDGGLVSTPPAEAIARGGAAGCDLVLSATRDEMALFLEAATIDPDKLAKRVARYAALDPAVAEQLVQGYRSALADAALPHAAVDVWAAIFSDREMTLPIRALLDDAAPHHDRTFGALVTWSGPPRPDGRPLGAAHAIDLPFTFGTFEADGWRAFVGAESPERAAAAESMSAALQSAIVRFAATGNPGWPAWSVGRSTYEFGESLELVADPLGPRAALWEAHA